ncbi:unnamed protein product [Cuscuta europaea]|uniref:Uncharacterized protein n=1 Tax=Cuscuta europaea TaxID=41803 RepID=A0A9P0ZNQ9_CUSEU|nr:unnamed protein product [Cuscuta europaea]
MYASEPQKMAADVPPPPPSSSSAPDVIMEELLPTGNSLYVHPHSSRHRSGCPHIHKLTHKMAVFERLTLSPTSPLPSRCVSPPPPSLPLILRRRSPLSPSSSSKYHLIARFVGQQDKLKALILFQYFIASSFCPTNKELRMMIR